MDMKNLTTPRFRAITKNPGNQSKAWKGLATVFPVKQKGKW